MLPFSALRRIVRWDSVDRQTERVSDRQIRTRAENAGIFMGLYLKIVTRQQAKAVGLSRFFVAKPCKRGHVVEQYVCNRKCVECARLELREAYRKDPAKRIKTVTNWYRDPANKPKRLAWLREYKKTKPTGHFTLQRREKSAGRPRPEVCEICEKPNQIKKPIYWDHCHKTGMFRGWICHRCNTILAKVEDSSDLLRQMADYLERASSHSVNKINNLSTQRNAVR
jgi:hypothetical protein